MTARASRQAQFELERTLRKRILASSPQDRQVVIAAAYAELFANVPDHNALQETVGSRRRLGLHGAGMIAPLARPGARVLEVGCGRGDVLAILAERGCRCTGTEPSRHMIDLCRQYEGIDFRVGTAEQLDFPADEFDLVYSMQVIEHLHPDDVPRHFAEAWRVLRPGGIIAVETPNCRTGPQDISRGFVPIAEGLHLKEWSIAELVQIARITGFQRIRGMLAPAVLARRWPLLHRATWVPAWLKRIEDAMLALVPGLSLRTLAGRLVGLDDIFLFAGKA